MKALVIGISLGSVLLIGILTGRYSVSRNAPAGTPPTAHSPGSTAGSSLRASFEDRASRQKRAPTSATAFHLLPPEEQAKNINLRLQHLREDLDSAPEPGGLLRKLFQDLDKLGPLHRAAFDGILENELARLDSKETEPMKWLTKVFPEISGILTARTYPNGTSAEDHVFDFLHTKSLSGHLNLLACIAQIDNPETKAEFQIELISRLIVSSGDTWQEQTDKLSSSVRAETEQRTMQLAARHKVYRAQAFEMYLRGDGVDGIHQDLVNSWFASPDWFWPSSTEFARTIAGTPPGPRRDEAIAGVIRLVGDADPDSTGQWLSMMSDQQRASSIRAALSNE